MPVACVAGAVSQVDLFALTDGQWDDGIARYGQPEVILHAFASPFAPESHRITGTAPHVDGGETKVF